MPPATPRYPFRRPAALDRAAPEEARLVIVGAGVAGLTLALDLAWRGVASIVLDEDDTVATGSRAICWAKRTLEIWGRFGIGQALRERGVTWNTGRVFAGEREAYSFDLLPEEGHEYPAFVNLQQYHVERALIAACEATGKVEFRWRNRVAGVENRADGASLRVETPEGEYRLHAEWLAAADGARSLLRESLALPHIGQVFRDRFLIADVTMQADFPPERWFWFNPPFHRGQSVLLHKQPDDLWRIDFQLGWDADPETEREPARVSRRIRAMLGEAVPFTLEWVSVYTFRCQRLERFRHGRILFLGDAAHQVSPFGARGGNAGVQDADNLAWKLAAVLDGTSPESLLESYDAERIPAADENILNSTRSTDFITPKNEAAQAWRDAVLELAARHAFARPLVNSGRLSRPALLAASPLSTPEEELWAGGLPPGAAAADAPVLRDGEPGWLLRHVGADGGCTLLAFAGPGEPGCAAPPGLARLLVSAREARGALFDHSGLAAARYGARPGDAVLLRPDQHVAARFRNPSPAAIAAAWARAMGRDRG